MGIGLRLSNEASIEILDGGYLDLFKQWLQDEGGYIYTMNGFPYGGFHHVDVKEQVHAPDWTTNDRVAYTNRLFQILSQLLPDGMEGGVSTSPLSYRYWFPDSQNLLEARQRATANMVLVLERLVDAHRSSGKMLHLDIEPEPDGILETGREFIDWFTDDLLPAGIRSLTSAFALNAAEAEAAVKSHIRLCYDVCHFAIGYEPHAAVIAELKQRGILVGKVQISAALKAFLPADLAERSAITEAFAGFNEPTYLHQVVARRADGSLIRYRDLPQALEDAANPTVVEWRAHFHVPIFEARFCLLESTRADIEEVLSLQRQHLFTQHLEVETYTWTVLEESLKLPIAESIVRELEWVLGQ